MAGRKQKISPQIWLETARNVLIEEGVTGLRIDRLARRLGVSRGGFYHNFPSFDEFADALLSLWGSECQFLPAARPANSIAAAGAWIEQAIDRFIGEDGYNPAFDMAVREWGRSEQRVAWAIERADRDRIVRLEDAFAKLGYAGGEESIRARVFYYHQVGFYTIGVRQSVADRRRNAHIYADILAGPELMARARSLIHVDGDEYEGAISARR